MNTKVDTEKSVNYTEGQVETLLAMYAEKGNAGLAEIAVALGKTVKSVRGKLISLKVYIKQEKVAKAPKEDGPSKKDLLKTFADVSGVSLEGLDHVTKGALANLIDFAKRAKVA